jgi:hypothetical protein
LPHYAKRPYRLLYDLEIVSSIQGIAWYGAQPKPHVSTEHKNLSADATDMLNAIWVCPMLLLVSCMKTSSTQPHAYSFLGPSVAAAAANSTSGWHAATLQCCTMHVPIFIVAPIFLSANVCQQNAQQSYAPVCKASSLDELALQLNAPPHSIPRQTRTHSPVG